LVDLGQFREAAALGPELLKRNPSSATPYANTARAFLGLGEPSEAEQWLQKALIISPNKSTTWTLLGSALGQLGRLEEAKEAFEKSISITPKNPAAELGLKQAQELLKAEDQAP
jgi:tetratricopeptide (TPR) repeat protein